MRPLIWVQAATFALISACISPLASAQVPEPRTTQGDIIWIMRPAIGRIPDGARAISLRVDLRCTVRAGKLTECAAVEPVAPGFEQSAVEAAERAHIAVEDTLGVATERREIVAPVGFPIPVAIDPPPAPPDPTFIVNMLWVERPSAQDFERNYPPAAMRAGVSARVILDCIVIEDGRLACNVISEEPARHGFGVASLQVARAFRSAPETRDGVATARRRVRVPISWRLG